MRRSLLSGAAAAITAIVIPVSAVLAAGPPVVNVTDHVVDAVSTFLDVHPCTGATAEVTVVESGAVHFLLFEDGTVRLTGTLRGTFSADAVPTDGTPDATGRYTVWFGSNGAITETGTPFGKAVTTFTLNGKGTNADGSTFSFHVLAHALFDQDGIAKIEFFKHHCR